MALDLNDFTANNNDLTDHNTVAEYTASLPFTTNGNVRGAGFTAASSQYFTAADSASLSITGDMTLQLWVNIATAVGGSGGYGFLSKYSTGSGQTSFRFYIYYTSGTPSLYFDASTNGTEAALVSRSVLWTPTVDTWYHVAVTLDVNSPGTAKFYVNGSQQGADQTGYDTTIFDGNLPLDIGRYDGASYLDGRLDDIRIYNSTRTEAAIAADYQQDLLDVTGLAAYWPFESPSAAVSGFYSIF